MRVQGNMTDVIAAWGCEMRTGLGVLLGAVRLLESSGRACANPTSYWENMRGDILALYRLAESFAASRVLQEATGFVRADILAEGCARYAQYLAGKDGPQWLLDIDGPLPVRARGDLLAHALSLLLGRACAATREGDFVHVAAGYAGADVWIAVSDTGHGLPDASASGRRALVREMQGEYRCRYEAGVGATETIWLPGAALRRR